MKKQTKKRKTNKGDLDYAETKRVKSHEDLTIDFLDKILGLNYYDCFISDETSLADFNEDEEFKLDIIGKVKDIYGVDITDTFDKKLVDVLDKIKSKR
jgi:hypothetical protein